MTIGDLRKAIDGLPDNMDLVGAYYDTAMFSCGMGTAQMGRPAKFVDNNDLALISGPTIFEISFRDHA